MTVKYGFGECSRRAISKSDNVCFRNCNHFPESSAVHLSQQEVLAATALPSTATLLRLIINLPIYSKTPGSLVQYSNGVLFQLLRFIRQIFFRNSTENFELHISTHN